MISTTWIPTSVVPFFTLVKKEVKRFVKVIVQTVVSPIISSFLYLLVFGVSLGNSVTLKSGVPSVTFNSGPHGDGTD